MTVDLSENRLPRRKTKRRPAPTPVVEYAPGHFAALVAQHDWPPGFRAQAALAKPIGYQAGGLARNPENERRAKSGIGWGNGTILLPGTPKTGRPSFMHRARAK